MGAIGGLALILAVTAAGLPADKVSLREVVRVGDSTLASVDLTAVGVVKQVGAPGAAEPKPLDLKVESHLKFDDRVAAVDRAGWARKSARRVVKAVAVVDGQITPQNTMIRPDLATLVASNQAGAIAVGSLGGPMTRSELELVQGAGDPLILPLLLPVDPVAVGDHWTVHELASKNLSGYDALATNALEATLEAVDASTARFRLLGTIRGAALGGEGSMAINGSFTFDRKAMRVDRLAIKRSEARKPGPVEAGLDVKSVLTVTRAEATHPESPDAASMTKALEVDPAKELLLYTSPDRKYQLVHDRDWHLYWEDARQVVFKRLDRGELVAQCNLSLGPNAGKGRHQDVKQFAADVRKALGDRFVQVVGQGEVEGSPAGGYRYKLTVEGRQGDAGVLWHYYLIAGPEGDQVIGTFTLGLAEQARFADHDLRLIGSMEWK